MDQMNQVAHPWHISVGDRAPEIVRAVIEIPKGCKMKYELDKPSGLLKLDRVIHSSMIYPANYGLVPQTYFEDGDPLDILVLCSMEVVPLCIVDARVIGMMQMEDENGKDDKILAVAHYDPSYDHLHDINDLPSHTMDELKNFFELYKTLEKKKVIVGNMVGREEGCRCVSDSMKLYRQKFNVK